MEFTPLLILVSLIINLSALIVMSAVEAIAHMMASRKNASSEVESPWRIGE